MATLQQALTRIDAICPNAWDDAAKIQWLNECEHMIQMRILDAAPEQCVTYDADTERGTVLLVPAPFDRLYVYYVIAMCDYAAHETAHYADSMALFNAALMEQAARRGDNAAAAVYEQQRNAKIRGEGMAGQEQTSDYAQYLPIEDVPDYDDTHRREAEALLTGRGTADRREQIDRMLDALLGEQFDYDPASDKLYAAYRQQYERQAELAAENALGKAAALTGGQASTAAVAASQQAGGYYRAMLAGKLPELAQLAYERYSGERRTRLSAIDRMLDAADSRDGVTKAQIAALLDMDDAAYDRADSKLQQQAKALADAKAAADKKAKAEQTAAEKEKAARDKAQTAARSDARRQIALILRNGGTVPGDLWQQSGYSAVTIAAMLRGRKG